MGQAHADSLSLVRFDTNSYSVPTKYAHRQITIVATIAEVRLVFEETLIARHERHWGRERTCFNPIHYLSLLVRKWGACHHVRLLMTIPGFDYCTAVTLMAALGDLSRFNDGDQAASYLGLIPSIKQSANTCSYGSITKQGNSHARWMLTQAAQNMARHPGPLGVSFRRLAKRKCWNIAVCATARKLVTIAWLMLKNNEPYRYASPTTTQQKLTHLRVAVTGQQRKAEHKGRRLNGTVELYVVLSSVVM